MKVENNMQNTNQIIPELLDMAKMTAHEKALNNEIAVHLKQAESSDLFAFNYSGV